MENRANSPRNKFLMKAYKDSISQILGVNEYELLDVATTQQIVEKIKLLPLKHKATLLSPEDASPLFQKLNGKLDTAFVYVFVKNSRECGAVKAPTNKVLDRILEFRKVEGDIVSIVSADINKRILIDFLDDNRIEIETTDGF